MIQECEQVIKSKKPNMLWMPYQRGKVFQNFKENEKCINIVYEFSESNSTMVFKIAIVKFFNDYPKLKKFSLSLHFWKNKSLNS